MRQLYKYDKDQTDSIELPLKVEFSINLTHKFSILR